MSAIVAEDRSLLEYVSEAVASEVLSRQGHAVRSRLVRAIARTPGGVVLTLNYDTLIEEAARERGRGAHSLVLGDVPELINDHLYEPDGDLRVVHLHGIVDYPSSLVLAHDAYMRQSNDHRVGDLFIALTARHNLCALGTRFEEDYLASIMLARRPSRPRHVIVCDVELAARVRADEAGLGADRHHWLPCGYPVGEHEVLDSFCEQLVTCDDAAVDGGPVISVASEAPDEEYAPRRLIARDELEQDTRLDAEMQLLFTGLAAHSEDVLEREQLSIVVGSPGSGKTRLLQELAVRGRSGERALFLRMRDVRELVGEPELLLSAWLGRATALEGEPINVRDVLEDRVRLWLLLDGLDEAPLEHRVRVATAVERLAQAYPQHRFTVTSRPVPVLADLSTPWRVFDLLCDDEWRRAFLEVNGVDEGSFAAALGPAGPQLTSLLSVPFFLRGAVRLIAAGESVGDAMQISLALLEQAIDADERLTVLGGAPRRWLTRVALVQQLTGEVTTGHDTLAALAAEQDLGDPFFLADLLAGRSLLAASADRWAFEHRLFGEALVAEYVLGRDPAEWRDAVAPEVEGWSAVLNHWHAPLRMVLGRSADWRRVIGARDARFAARATPPDAPVDERLEAASLLWRRAIGWDVWIDPMRRDAETVTDGQVVAELLRQGGLAPLEAEIRGSFESPSRFARGSAVDVLGMVPVTDIAAVLADVLERDTDSVVRRSAASVARRLELTGLADLLVQRAMSPEDDSEAGDLASVALDLTPPETKLSVATALLEAGNTKVRGHVGLEGAPLPDRATWLAMRARDELGMSFGVSRELARLVEEIGTQNDPELIQTLGYVAALASAKDPSVVAFVASRHDAVRGVVQALEAEDVSRWEVARLLLAIGEEPLREAGADEGVLSIVATWQAHRQDVAPAPEEPGPDAAPADDLSEIVRLPTAQRRNELARRAHLNRDVPALTAPDRDALRQTLDDWWADSDLREGVRVTGRRASIAPWAMAVLTFAPAIQWTLDDDRWVQFATCGGLFEPQLEWLTATATQPRLDRSAEEAAGDFSALTDLLRVGVNLNLARVSERLAEIEESGLSDEDLRRAGHALSTANSTEGLELLAHQGDRWSAALRPHRAAAGDLEAQLAELAALQSALEAGQLPGPFDLEWMAAVRDPRALPALEGVLIAAGTTSAPLSYPHVTLPVLNTIIGIGDVPAADLLDRVARERPYPAAQFLVDDRDRLVQALLTPAAQPAAAALGEGLGLPLGDEITTE